MLKKLLICIVLLLITDTVFADEISGKDPDGKTSMILPVGSKFSINFSKDTECTFGIFWPIGHVSDYEKKEDAIQKAFNIYVDCLEKRLGEISMEITNQNDNRNINLEKKFEEIYIYQNDPLDLKNYEERFYITLLTTLEEYDKSDSRIELLEQFHVDIMTKLSDENNITLPKAAAKKKIQGISNDTGVFIGKFNQNRPDPPKNENKKTFVNVFGFSLNAKGAEKVGSIMSGSQISPEAGLNLYYGWLFSSGMKSWLISKMGVKYCKYTLYDDAKVFEEQIYEKTDWKFSGEIYYNKIVTGWFVSGVSFEFKRTNNYDSLSEVTLTDTSVEDSSGGTDRIKEEKKTGREGTFDSKWLFDFKADCMFYYDRFALDLFGRLEYDFRINKYILSPGAGFFVTEDGDPLKIIGGIVLKAPKAEFRENLNINLVAGYNF